MKYTSPERIIDAVNEHLLSLRREGGRVAVEFESIQEVEERPNPIRLSNSGKCPRQMAYLKHVPEEAEELDARALNVFLLGDLIHDMERSLISVVTPLTDVEAEAWFDLGEGYPKVRGRMDGKVQLKKGAAILDIKSTATRGFTEMVKNGPRFDHLCQLNAYLDAEGLEHGILWVYNKDTSHRHAFEVERDPEIVEGVRARFRSVIDSAGLDDLPERMYEPMPEMRKMKPTGREYLPWQCTYCPFTERCWSSEGFGLVFESNRPRWLKAAPEEEAS